MAGAGILRPAPAFGLRGRTRPPAPAPCGFGALRYAPPLGPLRSLGAACPSGGVPGSLRAAVGGGPKVGPLAPPWPPAARRRPSLGGGGPPLLGPVGLVRPGFARALAGYPSSVRLGSPCVPAGRGCGPPRPFSAPWSPLRSRRPCGAPQPPGGLGPVSLVAKAPRWAQAWPPLRPLRGLALRSSRRGPVPPSGRPWWPPAPGGGHAGRKDLTKDPGGPGSAS